MVTEVHIAEPALRAQNLTLVTWTSSFILASVLHKLDINISSRSRVPVLELGAGTGLVGLMAASLWKKPVYLTDLSPIVPALSSNISLNSATIKDLVKCGSLDWNEPDFLFVGEGEKISADTDKAQVILAADTMYSEEHPELLSKAIFRWLAPDSSARVIMTWAMRVAYLDQIREIWAILETTGLECILEGREQATDDSWDDEGLCEWSVWRWKTK
jgi:predicted nicotinamide N-methyase